MIKSLSPYYVTIPFVSPLSGLTCTEYTLEVYVWNGNKNTPPIAPVYEFTKSNPTLSTENDLIDISNIINDFINFIPKVNNSTDLLDGNNQNWVKVQTFYTTTDPLDLTTPTNVSIQLMTKGYGYGMDGQNPQIPTNKILLSGTEFKVNRGGTFVLPILIDETTDESEILITNVVNIIGSTYQYSFTSNFLFTELYSQVRLNSGASWSGSFLFSGTTSPQSRVVSFGGGSFQTRIYAFNPLTGNTIYSNIFNV